MTSWITPIVVLVLGLIASYHIIIKGEVEDSIVMFGRWAGQKLGKKTRQCWLQVRKVRKLVNYPFRQALHASTIFIPFALGQVWEGRGISITLIGWAANKDWVVDFGKGRRLIMSANNLRETLIENRAYLYDLNEEIDYTPKAIELYGSKVVILERA